MRVDGVTTGLGERYQEAKFRDPTRTAAVVEEFTTLIDVRPLEPADVVVAVPSRTPLASAFAAAIADALHAPLAPSESLTFTRDVVELKKVDPAARAGYVCGALRARAVTGTVVLVDDVVRTGSMIAEAARALRAVGASDVMALAMLVVD